MHSDDIVLDATTRHVNVTAHSWRRLKTESSARHIPLVGKALWAAYRLQQHESSYTFPGYCDGQTCKANSVSAALNKWLKQTIGDGYVIHSFRHSMRDRLRAVNCPSEMIDQIDGWSSGKVGEGYGEGYSISQVRVWLLNLERTVYRI